MAGEDENQLWKALGEYRGPSSCKALVRYMAACHKERIDGILLAAYVTDQLRMIPQMSYLSRRWLDVKMGWGDDDSTADEIVDSVIAKIGDSCGPARD